MICECYRGYVCGLSNGGWIKESITLGFVSYLEVIDAQRTSLATERSSAQLTAQRLNASVALIKALGGGWRTTPDSLLAAR